MLLVATKVKTEAPRIASNHRQRSGVEAAVTVQPSYGLSEQEIVRMLQDSQVHAQDDAQSRMLREQKVDAERALEATEAALLADGDLLLDAEERAGIDAAMATLHHTLSGADADTIRAATATLNRLTTPYAARRMDHAVRSALSGQNIEELC